MGAQANITRILEHRYIGYVMRFIFANILLLLMFFILRSALYLENSILAASASQAALVNAFFIGARFDLRVGILACLPLAFIGIIPSKIYKKICLYWFSFFASVFLLFGMIELEFYAEFQQRLNGLVFQYLKEDFSTAMYMVWTGLPVITYLIGWLCGTWLLWYLFKFLLDRTCSNVKNHSGVRNIPVTVFLVLLTIVAWRGTLRSGPPLRWGDAYQSDNMFLNHLALNGSFTLFKAMVYHKSDDAESKWLKALPDQEALSVTRTMIMTKGDRLVDEDQAALRRVSGAYSSTAISPRNLVIILLESFSGQFVGALGNKSGVTPEFDALTKEGVLFTNFYSNGTHTHQGIFTTLSSFPNLPGYEYLMQQPEGRSQFSGLTRLMPEMETLFIYNGDFSWDNQSGYLRNQGLKHFIGRYDYRNPVFVDPVWGVSDEDMFNRASEEWKKLSATQPFLLILQSLSNHMPYSLPEPLAFDPITDQGDISQRLTAMKYSDWALGQFFREIRKTKKFADTLFVIVGDHGFEVENQLTEINLLRFHVPMLMIGPGLQEQSGNHIKTIGSQIDIIPTIVGQMGKPIQHQAWGRDLFDLAENDGGLAIIKPSGDESTIAILKDDLVLTYGHDRGSHLYRTQLYPYPMAQPLLEPEIEKVMERELRAFVQTAMSSLIQNKTSN